MTLRMNASASAWHAGERALQQRAGVAERMAEVGQRVLRDFMPDQHREFFASLPLLYTGTLDGEGHPWASLLAGEPGFAHAPDPRVLRIAARALAGDPLGQHLRAGCPIGLLGLQAHTRRRNRMNGWITSIDEAGCSVRVGQSFGNCPKYIAPREAAHAPALDGGQARWLQELDEAALRIVRAADTFFIATAHPAAGDSPDPAHGIDVSHRGGPAGFVQVEPDGTLAVADYAGNTFFNTFGNLALQPRCGLLFIDFATGERLHLKARGSVEWDGPQRRLRLQAAAALHVRGGLPVQWREPAAA